MKRCAASLVMIVLAVIGGRGGDAFAKARSRVLVSTMDLGTMDGNYTLATAINEHGAIVGSAFSSTAGHGVAFLWTPERGFRKILGEAESNAIGLNDRGDVIGYIVRGEFIAGFLWSAANGVTDLSTFIPTGINNQRQIAGNCNADSDLDTSRLQACLWHRGVLTTLAPFGSGASAINNRGHVVGQRRFEDTFKAFMWTMRNGIIALAGPGTTSASAINEHDEVVGGLCCIDESGPDERGIMWRDEDTFRLFPVGTILVGINEHGDIIGRRGNPWQGVLMTRDRVTVVLGQGLPVAINDHRRIAGSVAGADGTTHLVVWTARERGRSGGM
jgi:uncharacterized membrane protein